MKWLLSPFCSERPDLSKFNNHLKVCLWCEPRCSVLHSRFTPPDPSLRRTGAGEELGPLLGLSAGRQVLLAPLLTSPSLPKRKGHALLLPPTPTPVPVRGPVVFLIGRSLRCWLGHAELEDGLIHLKVKVHEGVTPSLCTCVASGQPLFCPC